MTQEIDAFMKYLQEVKKISKNTAVSYETDLRKMKEFLYSEGVLSVEDVRQEHLKIYMEKQEQEGKKPATISRGLASMKAFFQYLVVQNYVNQNVTDGLKAPKLEKKAPFYGRNQPAFRPAKRKYTEGIKGPCDVRIALCDGNPCL